MYRNAVQYKGVWLSLNSECFELYQAKQWSKLDALMKEVEQRANKLEGKRC